MPRQFIYFFLLLILLADIGYSFLQHLQMPLDGDMAAGIIPSNDVKKIFEDPFGISVITENAFYSNPNRFFAHWVFSRYFLIVPIALQYFFNQIDSIYLSCALIKILIQIFLLILLSFYITGNQKIFSNSFLIAAVLIVPLFQINGYESYMGIIDPSITYTFFYALPCALLLFFYYPFYKTSYLGFNFTHSKIKMLFLILFSIILVFNGPLNPGVILIISFLYILHNWRNYFLKLFHLAFFQRAIYALNCISKPHLIMFSFVSVLSIYSLFIGLNNAIFIGDQLPINERFYRIPSGLFFLIFQKIGYPVLLIMVLINTYLISINNNSIEGRKIINLLKGIGIFAFLYIILLPFGGYKNYRPFILRYDTVMPITILIFFYYGKSAFFLLNNLGKKSKKLYISLVIIFSFIFTLADKPEFNKNECERAAIETIANSTEPIVLINMDCSIMAWGKYKDPVESELNSELLLLWGITKQKRLYYQK